MFEGPHLDLVVYRGWTRILDSAFASIERVLVGRSRALFHWVSIDLQDGRARCVYSLGENWQYLTDIDDESRRAVAVVRSEELTDLVSLIDVIVFEAERLSGESCLVCGARSERAFYFGVLLALCPEHQPGLMNRMEEEGLEGVWRESIVLEVLRSRHCSAYRTTLERARRSRSCHEAIGSVPPQSVRSELDEEE